MYLLVYDLLYSILLIYIFMKVKAKTIGQYKVIDHQLGNGMMGKVFLGQWIKQPGVYIAVKEINISKLDPYKQKQIENEILNSSKLQSPFIVKLYNYARTQNHLYMFLQFCQDGDLKSYIERKNGRLSQVQAIAFFRHIVEGFRQLIKHNIIHRDIKPANILLKQGIAKITDFGFSRVVEKLQQSAIFTYVGTPLYTSPQILRKQKFSSKCDVWSVGVVFYEMLYGKTPWTGTDLKSLTQNITQNQVQFKLPSRSELVKDLIRRMLTLDEKQRISWAEIYEHPLCKQQITNVKELKADYQQCIVGFIQYLNQNVVRGYLKNYINKFEHSSGDLGKLQPQQIVTFRKNMLGIFSKLMYHRNLAFFYNYILGLYYKFKDKLPKKFNQHYQLQYIFLKMANDLIIGIIKTYLIPQFPSEIKKQLWILFKNTSEFNNIKSLLQQDFKILKQMINVVSQKMTQVYIKNKGGERIVKALDSMEGQYWNKIFTTVLNQNIDIMKKSLNKQKNDMAVGFLFKQYLEIAVNPIKYFANQGFDFHSFYENNQSKYNLIA